MVILVSSTSICWRLFVNPPLSWLIIVHSCQIYVSSGVIQSHPGPGHPGSQLIIRICVIWLDLPLLVLNCTHSVTWTFCLTLKTTFWPTFTSVNLRQEPGLVTFNVDERFFTSLHNYMLPIAGHECSHINHVKTPVNGDRLCKTLLKIAFSNFSDNMLLSTIMLFCFPKYPLEQLLFTMIATREALFIDWSLLDVVRTGQAMIGDLFVLTPINTAEPKPISSLL